MHRRPFARLWLISLLVVLAGLAACAPAPTAPPLSTRAPTRPASLTAAAPERPPPTLFPSQNWQKVAGTERAGDGNPMDLTITNGLLPTNFYRVGYED